MREMFPWDNIKSIIKIFPQFIPGFAAQKPNYDGVDCPGARVTRTGRKVMADVMDLMVMSSAELTTDRLCS